MNFPGARGERPFILWVKELICYFYLKEGLGPQRIARVESDYHKKVRSIATDKQQAVLEILIETESIAEHLEKLFLLQAVLAEKREELSNRDKFNGLTRSIFALRRTTTGALILLSCGMDSVCRQNLRCLYEICLSVCRMSFDSEFAKEYLSISNTESANKFWHRNFSKRKTETVLLDFCQRESTTCPLISDNWFSGANKMLGASVHPNGMNFAISFQKAWQETSDQYEEKPTDFTLFYLALAVSTTLSFLLSNIGSSLAETEPYDAHKELDPFSFNHAKAIKFGSAINGFALILAGLTNHKDSE